MLVDSLPYRYVGTFVVYYKVTLNHLIMINDVSDRSWSPTYTPWCYEFEIVVCGGDCSFDLSKLLAARSPLSEM